MSAGVEEEDPLGAARGCLLVLPLVLLAWAVALVLLWLGVLL